MNGYHTGIDAAGLRAVLAAGHAAPSILNTQPWQFAIGADGISLYADRHHQLQHIDPLGREQVISCGTAVLNMRAAAEALGCPVRVTLLPDPSTPQHLATISFDAYTSQQLPLAELAGAIHHRRDEAFDTWPVADELMIQLHAAAATEGARLHLLGPQRRRYLARLVHSGNAVSAGGRPSDVSERWLAITTSADGVCAWLTAGQATQRVVLTAETLGIGISFTTQPLEVPLPRHETGTLVAPDLHAQVLLRLAPSAQRPGAVRLLLGSVVRLDRDEWAMAVDRRKT